VLAGATGPLLAASPVPRESGQMLLALSPGWDDRAVTVQRYERDTPEAPWRARGRPLAASLGRAGLAWGRGLHGAGLEGPRKKEGDERSPAGVFLLRETTGYAASAPAGTRLPYREATPSLRCVDDPRSAHYNRLVDEARVTKDWTSAEDMRRQDDLYRLVVWVGHNDDPPVAGAGSCIFLHFRETPSAVTAGCTAFDHGVMEELVAWLDPAARPVLVQLPRAVYARIQGAWELPTLAAAEEARPRARDLGLTPGVFAPGPLNAITDVTGVRVGQVTLILGENVRTGVTAVLPHGGNLFQEKVAGAVFVGNAFGKLAGSPQVEELGTIETPIVLTNTLAVGTAVEAIVRFTLAQPGNQGIRSVNALVGETNDGGLNDIRSLPVSREHVERAIRDARSGEVAEGSVGAGTGTIAFGWKGGIGTSSRVLPAAEGGHVLGVLVQANFGGVLVMDGVPVGKELGRHAFAPAAGGDGGASGSCLIVVATNAPLDAKALKRLAARALFGLARTGSSFSNGSGDYAIAFSTAMDMRFRHGATEPRARGTLPTDALDGLFEAALEATEESVLNALLRARTVSGMGRTAEAIPLEGLREILRQYGRGDSND